MAILHRDLQFLLCNAKKSLFRPGYSRVSSRLYFSVLLYFTFQMSYMILIKPVGISGVTASASLRLLYYPYRKPSPVQFSFIIILKPFYLSITIFKQRPSINFSLLLNQNTFKYKNSNL